MGWRPVIDQKNRPEAVLPAGLFIHSLGGEHVLAQAADGADPIFGDIFPGGAGSDAAVGIADGGVIDIAAGADILHGAVSFRF